MNDTPDAAEVEEAVTSGRADYGRIYFHSPRVSLQPASTAELASTLRSRHDQGDRVTIRNTGHSTNGQTLTDAVQVSLDALTGVTFDRDAMTARVGAGTSWHEAIQGVGFPEFAPAIFPNNPGQLIRVGGTASVGGVGFYCSRHGGFWNQVEALTLVTMTGDIVECSRQREADLFRYALGGYGRVGVISDVTIRVVPSKPKVFALVLAYFHEDVFERDLLKAFADPRFHGVAAQRDVSGWEATLLDALGIDLKLVIVMMEVDGGADPRQLAASIREDYDEELALYLEAGADVAGLELSMRPRVFDKRDVVYFTPTEQSWWRTIWLRLVGLFTRGRSSSTVDHEQLCHPWSDCLVAPARHGEFVREVGALIKHHGLQRSLEKESFVGGLVDIDSFVTFGIRRMWTDESERLPLSLDLPDVDDFTLGVAIMPNVARHELDKGLALSRDVSDLAYACGGRRYLYGTHDLTAAQIEQHYGRHVIEEWQRLKDVHDPRHLLNIGVIEHLDA